LLSTLTARVQLLNSYISAGETDSTLITSNQYHSESQLDQEIQFPLALIPYVLNGLQHALEAHK